MTLAQERVGSRTGPAPPPDRDPPGRYCRRVIHEANLGPARDTRGRSRNRRCLGIGEEREGVGHGTGVRAAARQDDVCAVRALRPPVPLRRVQEGGRHVQHPERARTGHDPAVAGRPVHHERREGHPRRPARLGHRRIHRERRSCQGREDDRLRPPHAERQGELLRLVRQRRRRQDHGERARRRAEGERRRIPSTRSSPS